MKQFIYCIHMTRTFSLLTTAYVEAENPEKAEATAIEQSNGDKLRWRELNAPKLEITSIDRMSHDDYAKMIRTTTE